MQKKGVHEWDGSGSRFNDVHRSIFEKLFVFSRLVEINIFWARLEEMTLTFVLEIAQFRISTGEKNMYTKKI